MNSELTRRQQLAGRKEEDEWRLTLRLRRTHYRSQTARAQVTNTFSTTFHLVLPTVWSSHTRTTTYKQPSNVVTNSITNFMEFIICNGVISSISESWGILIDAYMR